MTRFEMEMTGALGEFWKKEAQKKVDRVVEEFVNGQITIDWSTGVAYNRIGRVVTEEVAELMEYAAIDIDRKATAAARDAEISKVLENYHPVITDEDMAEMRAAFGTGTKVVDVLSGDVYEL